MLTWYPIASIPEPQREAWKKYQAHPFADKAEFEKEVVRHVETTLARSMFNCDETAAYAAASLAFRDRLITEWNRTQQRQTFSDTKRIYYLSLEFLMGRALDNAMLNVGLKNAAKGMSTKAPQIQSRTDFPVQRASPILVSVSRISLIRSTMLRLVMEVSVDLLLVSWIRWHL